MTKGAYAKLHHDMQHFVTEAIAEQLIAIKNSIAQCARKAQKAGIDAIEILGACEKVKSVVSCPVATVGRVVSVEAGEKIL